MFLLDLQISILFLLFNCKIEIVYLLSVDTIGFVSVYLPPISLDWNSLLL
jgi:hypothetical protein